MSQARRGTSLVDDLTAALSANIRSRIDLPGARLPSVHALTERYGVSRTVVREALARLRAEGLVVAKHGSGVFVAGPARLPLRLDTMDPIRPERVIQILELRMGVETEAAALAAARATASQKAAIASAIQALGAIAEQSKEGVDEDFRFHTAVAEATGNPMYPLVVNFLTEHFRASIQAVRREGSSRQSMLRDVVSEHAMVAQAIAHGDADEARWAMRRHLRNGWQRVLASLTI